MYQSDRLQLKEVCMSKFLRPLLATKSLTRGVGADLPISKRWKNYGLFSVVLAQISFSGEEPRSMTIDTAINCQGHFSTESSTVTAVTSLFTSAA
jgi:hypothetical protein